MENFIRLGRQSAEVMDNVNQKIDYLHLSLFADVTKRENETYTMLQFKPFFLVERIVAVPRSNESEGEPRPPRWYQRMYSVAVLLLVVYFVQKSPKKSWHENVTDNDTLTSMDHYIYWVTGLFGLFYVVMLAYKGIIGIGGDCLRPFFVLCDLDRHLNILGHSSIYIKLYWKNVANIALTVIVNVVMLGSGVVLENFELHDMMGLLPITYIETEGILCSTISLALATRLRHLTRLSVARHLKRRHYSQPYGCEFELCGISEFNLRKILLVYEKIIETFNATREHFKFHMLVYVSMKSYNVVVSIWKMLIHIRNKEENAMSYLCYFLFCVRAFLEVFGLCRRFESFTIAVEQFRIHLYDVIQLDHPVWSAEARELLVYSEAGNVNFSVCHMFNMDIHMPFIFFRMMFTFCVALAQDPAESHIPAAPENIYMYENIKFTTVKAMKNINQKIDDLHLSLFADITERENKSYTLLPFKPFLLVEKFVGVARHCESGAAPSWYQRVYSVTLISLILYLISQYSVLRHRNVDDNGILSTGDYYLYFFSHVLNGWFYFAMVIRNGFFGPEADSFGPFLALCDLDRELNILGHKSLHTKQYWRHVAHLSLLLSASCLTVCAVVLLGDLMLLDMIALLAFTYIETEPLLYGTVVAALDTRLRHLTSLSAARHLKRRQYVPRQFIHEEMFELHGVRDYNFQKLIQIYDKIINTFSIVSNKSGLQMLAFFSAISMNILVTLWNVLLHIRNKKPCEDYFLVYLMYWLRCLLHILGLCSRFESFIVAVEQFRVHLLDVIQLDHPVWSAEARELLVYSEASSVKFPVCHMFDLDIHLPFTFVGAMFTFCIAMTQLVLER